MERCSYCGSTAQVRVTFEERNGKLYKIVTCGCGTTKIIEYVPTTTKIVDENGKERKF